MKKVLVLLALLAAVCGLLTFSAAAESAAASGICGENLTWTLDAAGTLTVSGTGAMKDYNYRGAPWYQSRDSIKTVVIESGVTTIGDSAFEDCSSLTSITIPEGVTAIGDFAFADCSSLSSITIPEGVTTIGDFAFADCSSLSSITIPEGVTTIGQGSVHRLHQPEQHHHPGERHHHRLPCVLRLQQSEGCFYHRSGGLVQHCFWQ